MPNDLLEKTLEDIIYENRKIIHTRGLPIVKDAAFRQVILPSGKKIDILGFEIKEGRVHFDIYELKRDTINSDAICQAYTYYQELKCITKNHFASISAKIIMVGRKYEPVSILDAISIPIKVFTYEYQMDGIKFKELHNPYEYSSPNESFSLGLWAFGYGGLTFSEDQSSMNFQTVFERYVNGRPDFKQTVTGYLSYYVKEVKLLPAPNPIEIEEVTPIVYKAIKQSITTEYFPAQPQWSKEFASSIPHYDLMDDLEEDNSDYEVEEDYDPSDFEPEWDNEPDPDEKWIVEEWTGKPKTNHPVMSYLTKTENQII